jgi:hypothetical protein
VVVDHLGLASKSVLATASVYPNPVANNEVIEFNGLESGNVAWMNIQGAVVAKSQVSAGKATVPVNLVSGIYLLQINSDKQQFAPVKVFVK